VRALKNRVVNAHCGFSAHVEKAGAIIVGKTNSPVMGFRGVCDNYLFGPSRNPFNVAKNTGGSSGGSAGAVADGLLPLAEGTDGGGSIRIPASWCGVYGYKASFGRVPYISRPNAFEGTMPFLFEGPITRTVEDAAIALSAIAGYDSRDPYSLEGTVDFPAATHRSIRGLKIAYSPNLDVFPVDPRVASVVAKAVQGQMIAITHNLMLFYEDRLEHDHGVTNQAEDDRREKRAAKRGRRTRSPLSCGSNAKIYSNCASLLSVPCLSSRKTRATKRSTNPPSRPISATPGATLMTAISLCPFSRRDRARCLKKKKNLWARAQR
jgi:Asp-tRNA(Asn)/Glu-tRNA(Gln) amidotransferase A subunit family amidase